MDIIVKKQTLGNLAVWLDAHDMPGSAQQVAAAADRIEALEAALRNLLQWVDPRTVPGTAYDDARAALKQD